MLQKRGEKILFQLQTKILLRSIVCNVIESVIGDSITAHLKKFKLIQDSLHGFMPGSSCPSNLLIFLEEVTSYIAQGHSVNVIYLDSSKAFDSVPYSKLQKKMKAHRISGKIEQWKSSWLIKRKQKLVIGVRSQI